MQIELHGECGGKGEVMLVRKGVERERQAVAVIDKSI